MGLLRGRVLAGVIITLVGATAVGVAVAATADEQEPFTADELVSPGASLQEIAAAASGKPGEAAPPCPAEAAVDELKASTIHFGPCDPLPEAGQELILPEAAVPAAPQQEGEHGYCYGTSIRMGQAPGEIVLELPCVESSADVPAFAAALEEGLADVPLPASEILQDVLKDLPADYVDELQAELPPDLTDRLPDGDEGLSDAAACEYHKKLLESAKPLPDTDGDPSTIAGVLPDGTQVGVSVSGEASVEGRTILDEARDTTC